MKTSTLLFIAIALLLAVSITFLILGSTSRASMLTEKINGLSYSLGYQIGKNLGGNKIEINQAMLMRGLDDGRNGQRSSLNEEQSSQAEPVIKVIMDCQGAVDSAGVFFHEDFMANDFFMDQGISIRRILAF